MPRRSAACRRLAAARCARLDGRPLPVAPHPAGGSHERLRAKNRHRGIHPQHDTCTGLGSHDRLDLPLAIDALTHGDARLQEPHPQPAVAP